MPAVRAARRPRPEHRLRGGGPARGRAARRRGGAALRGQGRQRHRAHLRRAARQTSRFANVLRSLGVGPRRPGLLPARPRPRAVRRGAGHAEEHERVLRRCSPRSAPSRSGSASRCGDGRVLVTTPALYRRKIAPIRDRCPGCATSCVDGDGPPPSRHASAWPTRSPRRPTDFAIPATDPEDMALLHFTSGTTGTPKGAVHVHDAVVAHHATARVRAGPAPRRRVLVHGRSRAGSPARRTGSSRR